MALQEFDEIKSYLRVTTEVEDELIEGITLSSKAWVRAYYGIPLESQSRTWTGRYPRKGIRGEPATQLTVPLKPCAATATITDLDDDTVDASTYVIDQRSGLIDTVRYEVFDNPPYTIALNVGWDQHPDYDDDVEPILRQLIFWAASTYYRNRNVAAIYEQSGGQVSITYTEEAIPPLLRALAESLRDKARAW